MKPERSCEIHCTACGRDSLIVRHPVYDGFTKTGETLHCAACGHVYASEDETPYITRPPRRAVFNADDHSTKPILFQEGENRCLCRYCANYIVNPFTQWCAVHKKEVEATDFCDQFTATETSPPQPDRPLTP